jgi:hypothetical protein
MTATVAHMRPSFFIVGVNKCGTSSLYRYLVSHPGVLPCAQKEPNFFGANSVDYIDRHIDEYFELFPTVDYRGALTFDWEASDEAGTSQPVPVHVERSPDGAYITGEASANTFHEVAPAVLARHLPDAKLIVVVRNPVDRAYSHHRMYRRFARTGGELGFPVGEFEPDLRAELQAYERGERTQYLYPGLYFELLQGWLAAYGPGQLHVVVTEDLREPPLNRHVMRALETYLGLPGHDYGQILNRRFNHAPAADMDPSLRDALGAFYRPHNERLQDYLGRELNWD